MAIKVNKIRKSREKIYGPYLFAQWHNASDRGWSKAFIETDPKIWQEMYMKKHCPESNTSQDGTRYQKYLDFAQ